MKDFLQKRYEIFAGIDRVLAAYKAGRTTLSAIANKVGVTKSTVSNDLKSVFGAEVVEEATNERRRVINKERLITSVNNGQSTEMFYDEAIAYLKNGEIARNGFLSEFEPIVDMAHSLTGKPHRVRFASHSIRKIEGEKGTVKIRYGEPQKTTAEYKIDRYRFKITPWLSKDADALIFCLKAKGKISYYIFPSAKLEKIQSLNLKFDNHEKSKYAVFLTKVEQHK